MKKAPKEVFGIYQDGQIIRMVHLRKDGAETFLLAVESLSLDSDWYKGDQAMGTVAEAGFVPVEDSYLDANDLDLGMDISISLDSSEEMDSLHDSSRFSGTPMEISPTTKMYAKFPMARGVIALNVHEEHIQKDEPGLVSKKELKTFRKNVLTRNQIKAGQWHSCVVDDAGESRHWLHTGPNLLLDSLQEYAKESRSKLYYQLADANDLALTDYYRYTENFEDSGIRLFAYLGQEYRKIFVFDNGEWIDTLPIHISQDYPEADVAFSKIALALDSAQVSEVQSIVLAGDLANQQLADYINSQNVSLNAKLLSFPHLTVAQSHEGLESEDQALTPYALALALAYKALHWENPVFSKCNFLPHKVLDNQKELRVVWHGFIVLSLIFALVLYTTISFLGKQQKLRQIRQDNTELTFQLNRLRAENAIIQTLTADINLIKQSREKLSILLKGKNRWTEVFNRINSTFALYPKSWISNMKQNGDRLSITGITARREHVSRLAEGLPDGRIRRVTHSKIKDQTVWNFEMDFVLPEVDWEEFLSSQDAVNTETEPTSSRSIATAKPRPAPAAETIKSNGYKYGQLPEILQANTPGPDEDELRQNKEFARSFQSFMEAVHQGNMLEYRFIGYAITNKYPQSSHLSLTRWWLAYRLYQEKEYTLAEEYLNSNLCQYDRYHPDSLLLKARLSYALSKPDYKQYYQTLREEYPRSKAAAQAALDLKYIEGGKR